jgi:hypothetical protein
LLEPYRRKGNWQSTLQPAYGCVGLEDGTANSPGKAKREELIFCFCFYAFGETRKRIVFEGFMEEKED